MREPEYHSDKARADRLACENERLRLENKDLRARLPASDVDAEIKRLKRISINLGELANNWQAKLALTRKSRDAWRKRAIAAKTGAAYRESAASQWEKLATTWRDRALAAEKKLRTEVEAVQRREPMLVQVAPFANGQAPWGE